MSKVMTSVLILLLISQNGFGDQNQPPPYVQGTFPNVQPDYAYCEKTQKAGTKEFKDCMLAQKDEAKNKFDEALKQSGNSESKQSCERLSKQFSDSAKELKTSCEETAALKSLDACFQSIKGCQDIESSNDDVLIGSNGDLYFNSEDGCEMIDKCPAKAAAHMKDWKKTANESEEKLSRLNGEKLDAEKDQADLVSRTAAEMRDLQKEIQDITNREQQILSRMPEITANLDLAAQEEINKLRDSLSQLEFEMDRANFAQNKAITEYQNTIGSIDAKCTGDANAKFNAVASDGNEGGLNSLLSSNPRRDSIRKRVVDHECTQPSVIEAKAAAQRNMNDRISEAQTAYTKYSNLSKVQRNSVNTIYSKFEAQKHAAAKRSEDEMRDLSNKRVNLMMKLTSMTQEMQSKTSIAQKRTADAQERSHRISQNMSLSMSNLKCSKSLTPSEKANAKSVMSFEAEFNITANTYCKAELACWKHGGVGQDFLKTVKGKEVELAKAGNCFELYKDNMIVKGDGTINERKPAAKTH